MIFVGSEMMPDFLGTIQLKVFIIKTLYLNVGKCQCLEGKIIFLKLSLLKQFYTTGRDKNVFMGRIKILLFSL